jgi:metallo-beta-lactamase family protein
VRVSWREAAGDRAILFSGDLGAIGAPLIGDPNRTWSEDDAVDFVVTESTYGDRVHPDRAESRRVFRDTVLRALDNGGKVLIPAFAIGRTQEVIYELNTLVERGELRGIPVIIDGPLGLNATEIYERHTECYDDEAMKLLRRGDKPLVFDHLHEVRDAGRSKAAVALEGPAIIVAGSGMLSGGRIRHHLAAHLPDPTCDVLLVGYQAEGTLGRHLQNGGDTAFLHGEEVPVRARITTIHGFSAHADRDGLAGWLGAVPRRPGGGVFVTHGEEQSAVAYSELVARRFDTRTLVPDFGETVALELRP